MDERSTLYPSDPPYGKTPAERQHDAQRVYLGAQTVSTLLDFRAAAVALACRNIEICPATIPSAMALGICQECLRACEDWREIVHVPSCQTGRVLAFGAVSLSSCILDVMPPPVAAADGPPFVETYSIVLDPPVPFGLDGAR